MAAPLGREADRRGAPSVSFGVGPAGAQPRRSPARGLDRVPRATNVAAKINRRGFAETEVRTTFFQRGQRPGSPAISGCGCQPGRDIVSRLRPRRRKREHRPSGHVAPSRRRAPQAGPPTTTGVAGFSNGRAKEWVRGDDPSDPAGGRGPVDVIVGYVEWLSPRPKGDGHSLVVGVPAIRWRSSAAPPPRGRVFRAASTRPPSNPSSVASGPRRARVSGSVVEVRKPDFRPTPPDLVVDVGDRALQSSCAHLPPPPAVGFGRRPGGLGDRSKPRHPAAAPRKMG